MLGLNACHSLRLQKQMVQMVEDLKVHNRDLHSLARLDQEQEKNSLETVGDLKQ